MVQGPWYGSGVALVYRCVIIMSMSDKNIPVQPDPSRRSFLTKIWMGLGILGLAECIGLVVAFLRPRQPRISEGEFGGMLTAGAVESFPHNSVTASGRGRFFLSRLDDGGFLALSRTCTHLGCTVRWVAEEHAFECPCHASAFDMTGNVTNPPAPRALDLYPVIIENGVVKVDTAKRIQRSRFTPSQVIHA